MTIKYELRPYIFLIFILLALSIKAQTAQPYYSKAFSDINSMLSDKDSLDFRKAIFLTENAYLENQLNEATFNSIIEIYASLCKSIISSGNITYTEKDKDKADAQCGVFVFMTDSMPIQTAEGISIHPPFSYNYEDFAGQKDWSNTFVSTLMQTQQGNCHSLPYLYKMIMDELQQESFLALAPNHIYIKAQNKKVGWYNIELTCSDFPTDAWLMASGYIHIDAIRNKIYMKALTNKESVAMTLVDLAQGYQAKYGIGDGTFMLQCCDTAIKYFPNYINAMLLKGDILTTLYNQSPDKVQMEEMNSLYVDIHQLGYRKMPTQMYQKWLGSLSTDKTEHQMRSVIVRK